MFDINGPRYRRSLNCGSATTERVRKGQEETEPMSNDERVVICRNRRPIAISWPRADVCQLAWCSDAACCCSAQRGTTRRVSANGKAASLVLPWRHDRSVDTSRERETGKCVHQPRRSTAVAYRLAKRDRFTPLMSTRSYARVAYGEKRIQSER